MMGQAVTTQSSIPAELQALPQWVAWKLVQKPGKPKPDKLPFDPKTGKSASTTDPKTWSDFETASRAADGRYNGVGFVFTPDDPYCGIDLDGCIDETGVLSAEAASIIRELDSYTEYSQSGRGVHISVKATVPPGGNRKGAVEIYDRGRYFCMTGNRMDGTNPTVNERQKEINALHQRLFGKKADEQPIPIKPGPTLSMTDAELIERASKASNGSKFSRLWAGDLSNHGEDASSADLALCDCLAFWTGRNAARIDSLFRQSGLMRHKWDEKRGVTTYGQRTIAKAIASCKEVYRGDGQHAKSTRKNATSGATAKPSPLAFPLSDAGNGELIAHLYGNRLRYDYRRQRWLLFDSMTGLWRPDPTDEVILLAKEAARRRYEAASLADDDGARKWAFGSESRFRIDAALALARSEPPIKEDGQHWDEDPLLLCVQNGVVDLRTGEFRPGRQDERLSMRCGVAYDAAAECPRFQQFIGEIFDGDPALEEYLWRVLGYCLTGLTREQQFYIPYGTGQNGKKVLTQTIAHLLGDYAAASQFQSFAVQRDPGKVRNDLARLAGKRFVTASEANRSTRLDEGLVKQLSGEDTVVSRHLYEKEFEYRPSFKLFLSCNHKPILTGTDHGLWRRVKLIPFRVRFDGEREDKDLENKLVAELPGVLNWLIEGALAYQADGLQEPEAVKAATADYRHASDVFGDFVNRCCQVDAPGTVSQSDLLAAFREWTGNDKATGTFIGIEMRERDFKKERQSVYGKRETVYFGLRLKDGNE